MKRRDFFSALGAAIVVAAARKDSHGVSSATRQVAVTMDDPNLLETPKFSPEERNRAILDALRQNSDLKAALFVCGKRVDSDEGRRLVRAWGEREHLIANHSYSHLYYPSDKVSVEAFSEDFLRGERVIKDLPRFRKIFRFPYLKEGDTAEKRDGLRALLREHGYRNGHVTIDASDWYVDDRLRKRLAKEPGADVAPYRDFYIKHILDRAAFYDGLAQKILRRSVRHTLLIHHNLLNALFLGDLLRAFKSDGWKLISAESAFKDKVFEAAPNILPAGESILWALAKETGKYDDVLRYPAEDSKYEKAEMDRLGL